MNIDLIGVPIDFGAGRRGVDMGPSAIRYAGLTEALTGLGHSVEDRGNVESPIAETCTVSEPKLRYLDCILPMTRRVHGRVAASLDQGHFPLTLGGDHSLALGSVRAAARGRKLGVLWIDAHGDFNTADTSPSGNIHGMPLAALAGFGDPRLVGEDGPAVQAAHIAIVGVRQLDPGERDLLKRAGVAVYSMEYIDRAGLYQTMREALSVVSRGTDGIYLSLDLDSLDPLYAPGVGTPVEGGLTYREAHLACEMTHATSGLIGMELVEVNPILDTQNATAKLAVGLTLSALGLRVWE